MVQQTPWAVIRCKFKDNDSNPEIRTMINKLFTSAGEGTFNMVRFFHDVSQGSVDLSGSQAFPTTPTWFQIDANVNDYVPPTDPPPPGWSAKIDRNTLIALAKQAAKDGVVPLDQFWGVIVCFNVAIGVTFGGVNIGGGPAVGCDYRWVENNGSTAFGQEMGHAYGLNHSRIDGSTQDYQDQWDVMSTLDSTYWSPDPDFGSKGPGLNAANMRMLQWLDSSRVWRGFARGFNEIIQLRTLLRHDLPGLLAAEFPTDFDNGLIVEFRVRDGWDAGIPTSVVLVHQSWLLDGHSYLMRGTSGSPGLRVGDVFDPNPSGAITPFQDHPRVEVLAIDDGNQTATLRLSYVPRSSFPMDGVAGSVLGQVAADGGGAIFSGGRVVPVPPWGPMFGILEQIAAWMSVDDVVDPSLRDTVRRSVLTEITKRAQSALEDLNPIRVPAPGQEPIQ